MASGHCVGQHKFRLYPIGQGEPQKSFKAETTCPLPHGIPRSHNIKFDSSCWWRFSCAETTGRDSGRGRITKDNTSTGQANALGEISATCYGNVRIRESNSASTLMKKRTPTVIEGPLHATNNAFFFCSHGNCGGWRCNLSFRETFSISNNQALDKPHRLWYCHCAKL